MRLSYAFFFAVDHIASFCEYAYLVEVFLSYLSFSFSSNAGYFNGRSESDELAIYADISPSGSCSMIGHFDTLLHFFRECLKTFCTFYMFSRNRATLSCLCCKNAPSISLSGGEWNTYIARQLIHILSYEILNIWIF